jgi:hypothetical protein
MTQKNPFAHLIAGFKAPSVGAGGGGSIPREEEKNISDSTKEGLTNVSEPANNEGDIGKALEAMGNMVSQFMTPQAQQLLTAGGPTAGGQTEPLESESKYDMVTNDLRELASINTESLEPQDERESNLNVEAKKFGQRLVLSEEGSVRQLCDRIDSLIEGNDALAGPALIETRNYVQQLMITLKSRPEFDSVLIDKDVRNVMKFIRATRHETLELREIKTVKKATRAANKEKKQSSLSGMEAAFNKIMGLK